MSLDADSLARDAWTPGRSAGAAARDLIAGLRCADRGSPLADMFEALLAENNRRANQLARAKRAVRWLLHVMGERPCPSGPVTLQQALVLAEGVLAPPGEPGSFLRPGPAPSPAPPVPRGEGRPR